MSKRTDESAAVPTLTTLLTMVTLAHKVLAALPPAAVNVPPEARQAMKKFFDLSKYHGLAPKDAPHIPDDGKI